MNIDRKALEASAHMTITNDGKQEEWRKISTLVPHFDDQQLYPTSVRYASSTGRLMRFNGEILDSFSTNEGGYDVVGLGLYQQRVHVIIPLRRALTSPQAPI